MNEQSLANLSPEARRGRIVQILNAHGECAVEELADRFVVSGMTIRRDLQVLAQAGRVMRTHGGASATTRVSFEFRFLQRMTEQADAKRQIAQAAVQFISEGDTVMLDSSTTTLAIARCLKTFERLTVITSSLPIASELFGCDRIEVLLLGGMLRRNSPDLVGAITDHSLKILRADVAFLGADAIDAKGNLYNVSPQVGQMLANMAQVADRVYGVADHTKLDCHALMCFANLTDWTGLICDDQMPTAFKRRLKRLGITVHVPKKKRAT